MTGRFLVIGVAAVALLAGLNPVLPAQSESAPSAHAIDWGRCANHDLRKAGATCGYLTVPLDYADPSGQTIQLAVSRLLHTSSAANYQGIMLMNTGGPGIVGRDNPLFASDFPHNVARDYDWIGLDPRGVGESIPALSCDPDYFVGPRPPYTPSSPTIAHRWLRKAAGYARACKNSAGAELLPHDSTVDWARDLESVRIALSADQINFYGFSYGTYLGQIYATMFPSHVRRMVLDSSIDPRGDDYYVMLSMSEPTQRNLNFWFRWVARHDDTYHLGATQAAVRHLFNKTEQRVKRHPAGGVVGQAEWVDIFFLNAFTAPDFYWPYLADVFGKYALRHKAGPLVDAYNYFAEDTTSDSTYATSEAVRCTDSAWPTRWQVWRHRAREQHKTGPFLTWGNAWYMMPCRTWSVPGASRFDVNGHRVRALLVADQFDGSIRFSANVAVRQRFENARLVEVRHGLAHADSFTNSCEKRYVNRYLTSGWLPARNSGRGADAVCSPDPRPQP